MTMLRYPVRRTAIPALLMAAVLGACVSSPSLPVAATFVLVRHAEKVDDGSKDPPLSATGEARAQALVTTLGGAPLRAIYATAYRRTQATATPTARAHSLSVTTYEAKIDAADFATQLRRDHGDGTVLVVGHSNTVPAIAAALCRCTVAPMGDDEFDRRITVDFDARGHAVLREDRY
jgi:broad specificity phosphatase PhoE